MPRNKEYAEYLNECASRATQRMNVLKNTPEGLLNEVVRQYKVMKQNLAIENEQREALERTKDIRYTS